MGKSIVEAFGFIVFIFFKQCLLIVLKKENLPTILNIAIGLGVLGTFFLIIAESILEAAVPSGSPVHIAASGVV